MAWGKSAWHVSVGGLIAVAQLGCGASEDVEEGCQWQRRTVERDERTAVLDESVANLGERFHVGQVWSCRVSWTPISQQSQAEWSPAGEDVEATLAFDWRSRAEEVTGRVRDGTRTACPAHLDIELGMSLRASDGSLAESWSVVGTYWALGADELSVEVHPHELGGYHGSYSLRWLSDWPETDSTLRVVLRSDGASGEIVEWTSGAAPADSGEGAQVSPATWTCEPP